MPHIPKSSTLKVAGATLYYETRGTGPTLLIIPGGPQDAGVFADLAAALADRYTVVAYDPGDDRSHLYLIQSADAADGAALESALQRLLPGSRDAKDRMTVIEQRPFTLHDQPVTLVISAGTNGAGEEIQQLTTVFPGRGGPVLLVLLEPAGRWNQATVDTFLTSIH